MTDAENDVTVQPAPANTKIRPVLTPTLMARLRAYGSPEKVGAGDLIYQLDDDNHDLILIESGRVDLLSDPATGQPPTPIAAMGSGDFLGEISLFTGERMFITARAREASTIYRIGADAFRQLMAQDAELSDVILTALYHRRDLLKIALADTIEILGQQNSAAALALVAYAVRMQLPHKWTDADTHRGTSLRSSLELEPADLPTVLLPDAVLVNATPSQLARHLAMSPTRIAMKTTDLVVIGGGPAGLAAAVYGASEGLQTTMLDAVAPGGQAAASSRIENYPGFPNGLSGADLVRRAEIQALKFGAHLYAPYRVVALNAESGESIELTLDDQSRITARAVILATGARYKTLPLPRWAEFEGCGIYYAATELEARRCAQASVAIIGGANSAGQAALFLAERCAHVTLILRGQDINTHMSAYLVDRVVNHPAITIATQTEVTELHGDDCLTSITMTKRPTGTATTIECGALFCFIGALPDTSWLPQISTDEDGFIHTDTQIANDLGPQWGSLARRPLPFETSIPRVFAVGDVRQGSMKRVAAAIGEGASAVASVHTVLNPGD
ncbi:MAG TPA: FAD-dependent oxidoreductase [Mycobacterium sp.]|nr:FAD-dependent oxidoreductase [Mycobacterium sp.]